MSYALLKDLRFFQLLHRVDQELAAEARAGGCVFCGGVLHSANYPRKPRACLAEAQNAYETRFSFCCSVCRKRCTSMSVRFLGRRVYLGLAVVLVSARLEAGSGIPIRTLERWRQWWQRDFALTPLWQAKCARFMPPVDIGRLPGALLERFVGQTAEPLLRLLLFLSPLTVRFMITIREGR